MWGMSSFILEQCWGYSEMHFFASSQYFRNVMILWGYNHASCFRQWKHQANNYVIMEVAIFMEPYSMRKNTFGLLNDDAQRKYQEIRNRCFNSASCLELQTDSMCWWTKVSFFQMILQVPFASPWTWVLDCVPFLWDPKRENPSGDDRLKSEWKCPY